MHTVHTKLHGCCVTHEVWIIHELRDFGETGLFWVVERRSNWIFFCMKEQVLLNTNNMLVIITHFLNENSNTATSKENELVTREKSSVKLAFPNFFWGVYVKISQNVDILAKVYLVHLKSPTLSNLTRSKYIYRSKWVDHFWLVLFLSCIAECGQSDSKNQ